MGEDYATGTKLYNQGRLSEAFDQFERSIRRKQNVKESEAYLISIREEIMQRTKKLAEERKALNYAGNSPESSLNVAHIAKSHIKITLRAKYLFDENTAVLKTTSLDVLNRIADLLRVNEGIRIELTMLDELDTHLYAKEIDSERALLIFAILNFKKIA